MALVEVQEKIIIINNEILFIERSVYFLHFIKRFHKCSPKEFIHVQRMY